MFDDDECGAWEDCKGIFRAEFEAETACRGCDEVHPSTEYCPKMFAKKEEWEHEARLQALEDAWKEIPAAVLNDRNSTDWVGRLSALIREAEQKML